MESDKEQLTKTILIASGISAILLLIVIFQRTLTKQATGTIVLPAGGTYLGPPSPTAAPLNTQTLDEKTVLVRGRTYPYTFTAPTNLKLVTFPNDSFDIYALSINNQPPEQNVLIGVDDLTRTPELKAHINTDKKAYVEQWWKQFSGLKGVASVTSFTNTKGLVGYKARFINAEGKTPNEDIFFVAPDPSYVIHLANGPLDKKVFDAIIDSVAWEKQ